MYSIHNVIAISGVQLGSTTTNYLQLNLKIYRRFSEFDEENRNKTSHSANSVVIPSTEIWLIWRCRLGYRVRNWWISYPWLNHISVTFDRWWGKIGKLSKNRLESANEKFSINKSNTSSVVLVCCRSIADCTFASIERRTAYEAKGEFTLNLAILEDIV